MNYVAIYRCKILVLLFFFSLITIPAAGQSGEELESLVMDLRRMRNHLGRLLPTLQPVKRANLAQKILARDSTNALAHLELGEQAERIYISRRNFISINNESVVQNSKSKSNFIQFSSDPNDPQQMRDLIKWRFRFNIERLFSLGVNALGDGHRAGGAYYKAEGHLMRAYAYDPDLYSVYMPLMRLFIASNQYERLLPVLDKFRSHFPEDVEVYLYSGLVHYNLGDIKKTSYFFNIARSHMSDSLQAVFDDFSYMLSERQKDLYNRNRILFAQRFWAANDVRMLTFPNERRLEHYARMAYADLFFGIEMGADYGWDTERGEIYVRYGAPRQYYQLRAKGTLMDNSRSEIWEYEDFRLVFSNTAYGEHPDYILYSPSAKALSNPHVNPWANDYVIEAHEQFRKQPSVSTYDSPGQRSRIPFLVSSFSSKIGSKLYIPFGVRLVGKPPQSQCFDRSMEAGAFLIDRDYGIISQDRGNIATLCSDRISTFGEGAIWTGVHMLSATQGVYKLSVEFATEGDLSVGFERISLAVPDYTVDRLLLSDILLAYHIEEVYDDKLSSPNEAFDIPDRIHRHGLSIAPAPWGVFDREQPIYFYFEIYNLKLRNERTSYEVEAALTPHDENGMIENLFESIFGSDEEAGVAVQFEATGTAADDGQYLIMNASGQPPGEYVLLLRVKDKVSGRAAEAKRIIVLE